MNYLSLIFVFLPLNALSEITSGKARNVSIAIPKMCEGAGCAKVPEALAFSGGACLAILTVSGWTRSSIISPEIAATYPSGYVANNFPSAVGTASGGGLYHTRNLVLREYP